MSMTITQQNIAQEMQDLAELLLPVRERLILATAMYAAESMSSLTDEDYQEWPVLAHITATEMNAAKGAMDSLITELGDFTAGEVAYKLMKICHIVPH